MEKNIRCPACNSGQLRDFLICKEVPVTQNRLYTSPAMAKQCAVGDIRLMTCERCGFIHNADFDESKVDYSPEYDNNQTLSPYFLQYLREEMDWLMDRFISPDNTIVEVGCGKGDYLQLLAKRLQGGKAYGFDTSYTGQADFPELGLHFYKEYFTEKFQFLKPDGIICRHVIEHIKQPVAFLQSLRNALQPGAFIFLETPNVDWILQNDIPYDFFYEHCSYWRPSSLKLALALAGFSVVESCAQFSGQYMWVVAEAVTPPPVVHPDKDEADFANMAQQYLARYNALIKHCVENLNTLSGSGEIALWGAGAKGSTLALLADPDRRFIQCVIDINPNKQGKYIGRTGHPVIAPEDIVKTKIRHIIVLNDNYMDEIKCQLAQQQHADIVLLSLDDFLSVQSSAANH